MIENPLSYILIRPNVINPEGLQELITHIKSSPAEDLSVFDPDKTNATGQTSWIVDKQTRDTQIVPMDHLYPKIEDLFRNTVKNIINPFYQVEVDSSEIPQVLSYGIGGHYRPHIDGRSLWVSPNGDRIWRRSTSRDLSIIFYINDEFEGGELIFPNLHIQIKPKPGMMVCFPSDQNYLHGVAPIKSGMRYSMVSWATVKGEQTKEEEDQELLRRYGVS
jgi:predicted 2-oxoglutarate/Fe(II)-dependent dioxygenase YbiX